MEVKGRLDPLGVCDEVRTKIPIIEHSTLPSHLAGIA